MAAVFWDDRKYLSSVGNQILGYTFCSLVTKHTELPRIPSSE